jgi:hypothetical protein
VTTRRQHRPSASAGKPQRVAKALHRMTFEHVRSIAHALPGVEDGTSYGTPALKVRGKLLARMHQSIDCLVLRVDFLDRHILMQAAPNVFFITDHYRDYPWVLVRFSVVDKGALSGVIERAWRVVAPKALVMEYDNDW